MGGLRAVGSVAVPLAGLLFICYSRQSLFITRLELFGQVACPFGAVRYKVLPAHCVDLQGLHVSLADVSTAQLWAANVSPASRQFSLEDVFGDSAFLHTVNVTEPAEPVMPE